MTVWAVHELQPKLRASLDPAKRFGEIRYVNQFYIHGDELEQRRVDVFGTGDGLSIKWENVNVVPTGYSVNMERCRSEFKFGHDYLLIAGDHLQLLALTALLVGYGGYLDVLRYDRQLQDYIPVRLYSGLVPPRDGVLVSGTHIGDNDHGESREKVYCEYCDKSHDPRVACPEYVNRRKLENLRAGIEAPLSRRDPFGPPKDDH